MVGLGAQTRFLPAIECEDRRGKPFWTGEGRPCSFDSSFPHNFELNYPSSGILSDLRSSMAIILDDAFFTPSLDISSSASNSPTAISVSLS
jgi:hypothetical protein